MICIVDLRGVLISVILEKGTLDIIIWGSNCCIAVQELKALLGQKRQENGVQYFDFDDYSAVPSI